jgi:hypothetical protein
VHVLETSFCQHIGDEDSPTPLFVRKMLEQYLDCPYKSAVVKETPEALPIYKQVLSTALERFEQKDTLGLFESPQIYITSFNAMCVDVARENHGLSEPDFLYIVDYNELTAKAEVQPLFERLCEALKAQLAHGEGGDDEEDEEVVAAQALERKKT